eukprot:m.139406 g.139406  ORF g.139406 m.139406 type:complete len:372 (-) comp16088_c0_seq2:1472-2587(-)
MACEAAKDTIKPAKEGEVTYASYLELDTLLQCQNPQSLKQTGTMAHDELLFITIHQAYELWFKQVLFELDSIRSAFMDPVVPERSMLQVGSRLKRIIEIFKLLVQQFTVLDTMTPSDFLSFRRYLGSSSGFQSVQFRLLENKLGVQAKSRVQYNSASYTSALNPEQTAEVVATESEPTLLALVEGWLERTPAVDDADWDVWGLLKANLEADHAKERAALAGETDETIRQLQEESLTRQEQLFATLFEKELHEAQVAKGNRRLSHKAFKAMLFISMYRHEPRFHLAYQLLSQLEEMDALMTKWRVSHVSLVQRMLGTKAGSGGSSGYYYLRSTLGDRYKVFLDLFNRSSFLVDQDLIPALPETIREQLNVAQ